MNSKKFGIMLPIMVPSPSLSFYHMLQYNYRKLDFDIVKKVALEAEQLEYHSVWASDHLSRGECIDRFESWTTLSVIASMTQKIRLGTMVLCNLYRHPGLLAKMAATLDVLSGGRLEFGIGACWAEDECIEHGIDFPKPSIRLQMLKESVEIIKRLWTKEKTRYYGKYYHIEDAYCEPKPIQKPHPPILIGGGGEEITLRIVARYADKSNFSGSIENMSRKINKLKKYCTTICRDYNAIEKTCNIGVIIHPTRKEYLEDMKRRYLTEGRPGHFKRWLEKVESTYVTGTPEECLDQIKKYIGIGVCYFIIYFGDIPKIDGMKLFAKEVLSKVKKDI